MGIWDKESRTMMWKEYYFCLLPESLSYDIYIAALGTASPCFSYIFSSSLLTQGYLFYTVYDTAKIVSIYSILLAQVHTAWLFWSAQ